MTEIFDAIIVGGGASGMMCACAAKGKKIAIVDSATKPAKKIMVTGNGRCNLTNLEISSDAYNQNIDRFLKKFGKEETSKFFDGLGLVTYADDEGRVYPLSNSAKSVVDVLEYGAKGTSFFLGEKIEKIEKANGQFCVVANGKTLRAKKLIIATGGNSADVLDMLGVTYKKFVPSLVSLESKGTRDLNGVRVSNVLVTAKNSFGETKSERGEILFRENGLSGIVVFNLSTLFSRRDNFVGSVSIDLLPDMDKKSVENLIKKRTILETSLDKIFVGMFSNAVANEIFKQTKINTNTPCVTLRDADISLLANAIKGLQFEVCGHLDNNQVHSGGVPLDDLDENLMHEKVSGLYFVGEVCDVDGVCGGYNLQWAWTSGHIVGERI